MNLAGILTPSTTTAVLVEGESDRAAVETLATRRGLPLADLGIQVVAMGGITNIGHHLVALTDAALANQARAGQTQVDQTAGQRTPIQQMPAQQIPTQEGDQPVRIGGLYDAAEERFVANGLFRVGLRPFAATSPLTELGFFRCDRDLEDELIRALGVDACLALVDAEGELRSFERLQGQPAQRDRTTTEQLHRFMGTRSGRKERYGRRLAEVLPLDRVPAPLDALLRWAA